MCAEHGVPERFCTLCHEELKAGLLLCAEHGGIPEEIAGKRVSYLKSAAWAGVEARQVFDLPPLRLEVTEHRLISRACTCGVITKADAPRKIDELQDETGRGQ